MVSLSACFSEDDAKRLTRLITVSDTVLDRVGPRACTPEVDCCEAPVPGVQALAATPIASATMAARANEPEVMGIIVAQAPKGGCWTAGLPCAIHAAQAGARVLLVEKDSRVGGTLYLSGGHMSAAGTGRQAERGIDDSVEGHLADIHRISRSTAREDLITIAAENAADTIEWLADRDFAFAPESPRIIYGHEPYTTARTYYGKDEGLSILDVLRAELEKTRAEHDLTVWTNA